MKIVSKFKDYYDSVQKYGQSSDIVYLRKTIRCANKSKYTLPSISYSHEDLTLMEGLDKFESLKTILNFCDSIPPDSILKPNKHGWSQYLIPKCSYGQPPWLIHHVGNKEIYYSVYRGLVLFCGEIHPVLMLNRFKLAQLNNYDLSNPIYIYTIKQLDLFITNNGLQTPKENRDLIENWLTEIKIINKDLLISNKIINLLVIKSSYFIDLIINPCLDDLQFQKVYDANTTFQKLDSFICGTLSYPQNELIEVSNEQKIIKHGFDPKYGFRTRREHK